MTIVLPFKIRKIEASDNNVLKQIVIDAIQEFNGDPETTMAGDPLLNTMYENYQYPGSVYYVVEWHGRVAGGCGISHLDGTKEQICELQRMFLIKDARRHGIGQSLLDLCLADAARFGYKFVYLETLSQMTGAIALYRTNGFEIVPSPLGTTGHEGCNVFMKRPV